MELFKTLESIYKFEKNIIYIFVLGMTFFLFSISDFSIEKIQDSKMIFSIFLMLSLTLFPYIVLLLMSQRLHKRTTQLTHYKTSLIITFIILFISGYLYYMSWLSLQSATGSTASLIYAVLPFYITIGIFIIYGLFMLSTKDVQ